MLYEGNLSLEFKSGWESDLERAVHKRLIENMSSSKSGTLTMEFEGLKVTCRVGVQRVDQEIGPADQIGVTATILLHTGTSHIDLGDKP